MNKFILAKKLGMTTVYKKDTADDVTLLEVGKSEVCGIRTREKDGYDAVQIGLYGSQKGADIQKEAKTGEEGGKKGGKGKRGKKRVKFEMKREFRVEDTKDFKIGDEVKLEQFAEGDKVVIQGICKGKGFQGVVKRHGFKGSPASHGHRHDLRAPGSIGSAFPEHVMKGKKMAGRMGNSSVTTKNIKVSMVDAEKGIIAVKGAVPGANGSLVEIYAE